jgi:uncharacterized protein YjbI with pentapeptide repeats
MLTKNLTPFQFGAKVTSRKPPQPEMTMVVRATLKLSPDQPLEAIEGMDQGFLSADVYREGDEERLGECLYPSDFADYKLNAEVLLTGTCYAPGGRPVTECPVRFSVGAWSKLLRVVGPRVWSDNLPGATASNPLSFTQMPLGYTNAFGGPGFPRNPVGKGRDSHELPTVELPGYTVRSRGDQLEPAGLGPINPAWAQRASKVGTLYGRAYQEKRAPFYAEDFDWTFFHAAPPDQQLKGYLRGDEEVVLHNLHPAAHVLSTRLPGIRVRAFVKDRAGAFREVYMSLDTLFIDGDKQRLYLTWRGLDKVMEDDLTDVKTVLIASERLEDKLLPDTHYREILENFEKDPTGVLAMIPPDLLEANERQKKGEAMGTAVEGQDPLSAIIQSKLGKPPAAAQGQLDKTAEALRDPAIASRIDLKTTVARAAEASADTPPFATPLKPGTMPNLRLRDTVRTVMAKVTELKKAAAEANRPMPELDALEALPNDPRLKQIDPSYSPPGPISTDEPGPYKNLSERDLTGRDLSGMHLRGANFESAILTKANLRNAKLTGANLRNAILYKADLTGAELIGADLTRVNAASMMAIGADLREAILEQAFFVQANLTLANLSDAKGEYVAFGQADLTDVKAQRARLDHSDFSKATLERTDFSNASLAGCLFAHCRGPGVNMGGAKLGGSSFAEADLTGARFVQARGERSFWLKATIDGADFGHSVMIGSHFSESSAVGARFYGANLRECRFYRASLERAEIIRANLFSADLSKARLDNAKFTGSSLYDAKFIQASGAGCDFTDANLKRSTLERT